MSYDIKAALIVITELDSVLIVWPPPTETGALVVSIQVFLC